MPYATLRDRRGNLPDLLGPVIGVYEWQAAPLLVLIDGDRLQGPDHLPRIRRVVALRGDIPYVGVAAGGRLDVYVVELERDRTEPVDFGAVDPSGTAILPYVASARPGLDPKAANVSKVVLDLLSLALAALVGCGMAQTDAISLAGRALFARFLADRDLPLGDHLTDLGTDMAFATPALARLTCAELERNFNGNLLPLDLDLLDELPKEGFDVLLDIMRRAPGGQMSLGWQQRWDDLHFGHIPVGILSQVYERYLSTHEPDRQKREGSYYTPTIIADLMVRATLQAIPVERRHQARFLDPAAGAGVFLITAFRHLVAERWRHDGVRPNTGVLRRILYDQVTGFDVNEGALRFAALGLYLVSIELDPEPEPISKLKFDDLRGSVLHRPRTNATMRHRRGEVSLAHLGSLGPGVSAFHDGQYDVVIGNPPWKTGLKIEGWAWVEAKVRAIAAERVRTTHRDQHAVTFDRTPVPMDPDDDQALSGSESRGDATLGRPSSLLPNNALDLPFVWQAAEWAKPDGQIALALSGGLLFQQSDGMPYARASLFAAFDVTSVINGAALRKTKVWPQITSPFCILFAKNRPPGPAAAMRFITPREEPRLNKAGIFRLDASHAPIVRTGDLAGDPLRLKTLFRGSELDLAIGRRITTEGYPRLAELVRSMGGRSGTGIQKLRKSSRTRKDARYPGADAAYLKGMPYIQVGIPKPFIDPRELTRFDAERIHDPRDIEIFRAPLLVVDKVARARKRGFASGLAMEDTAYSVNYYGYRFPRTPEGRRMAVHVAALLRSSFAQWWFLMTSGEYGYERDVVEKHTFDKLPIPSAGRAVDERSTLGEWYERHAEGLDQKELDRRVASAYGLTDIDRRIIEDTLTYAFGGPAIEREEDDLIPPARRSALLDVDGFLEGLNTELAPWERDFGIDLTAAPADAGASRTWRFVTLGRPKGVVTPAAREQALAGFVQAADESGSTEVYHQGTDGRLWIGMLDQPRYWTFSQGLRSARHIAWNHIEFLIDNGGSASLQ
ncbi:N-6 DNA methylase [Methylobacterium sp. 391_Methyba4]|uniref:N-6 DNA methylase n=1 Tax=Methylobacterium sp. 391_Methyba4 TaxID=3038924 RepID=UPI00241EC715|nr:N-6 DNA methylase [Methylobacterium sp. 391_Methyba4]WFS09707.1 N-6 DNA methylase [Methylobacterium sp. 391_Methyba4]